MELIKDLRQKRKAQGYTQGQVGKLLGIHGSHYSRIETGQLIPDESLTIRINNLFMHKDTTKDVESECIKQTINGKKITLPPIYRTTREKINLSLKEVSKLTGIPESTLGKYETGAQKCTVERKEKLDELYKQYIPTITKREQEPKEVKEVIKRAVPKESKELYIDNKVVEEKASVDEEKQTLILENKMLTKELELTKQQLYFTQGLLNKMFTNVSEITTKKR